MLTFSLAVMVPAISFVLNLKHRYFFLTMVHLSLPVKLDAI